MRVADDTHVGLKRGTTTAIQCVWLYAHSVNDAFEVVRKRTSVCRGYGWWACIVHNALPLSSQDATKATRQISDQRLTMI